MNECIKRREGSEEEWKHLFKASIEVEIERLKNTRRVEAVAADEK